MTPPTTPGLCACEISTVRAQTSRGIIHIITASRQYGHRRSRSMILAAQSPQADQCPQGTARCVRLRLGEAYDLREGVEDVECSAVEL